jgi:hypothetical protein
MSLPSTDEEAQSAYDWRNVIPDGLLWNEAQLERGHSLNRVLLSLFVLRDDPRHKLKIELVGTAFIIKADGATAAAVTAAHNFERVRQILHPDPLHHPSALPEFLPPPSELDLTNVKALYLDGKNAVVCNLELAAWDCDTDYALLFVKAPPHQSLFQEWLWLDDQVPEVGDPVCMIGLGEMEFTSNIDPVNFGTIQRRLVLRVGRVESLHQQGYYFVKTPCVETSIPAFPGMSGGIVARWTAPNTRIQPFGFISRSLDIGLSSSESYYDRSVSGRSIGAILKMEKTAIPDGGQTVGIQIRNTGVGRNNLSFMRRHTQRQGQNMDSTQPSPLILELCLVCDDIRQENNGKKILIGVYDDIMVQSLPTSISLCFWMRFKDPPLGTHVIECSILGERNQRLVPGQSVQMDFTHASPYYELMVRVLLHLIEPEIVRLLWRDNGGEWDEALSFKIGVQSTPVTMTPQMPSAVNAESPPIGDVPSRNQSSDGV